MNADSSGTRHEFISEADSDVRLDLLVAGRLGLSRTQAATLIAGNAVTVSAAGMVARAERASYRPRRGETISVVVPPAPGRDVVAEDIPLSVVHEDEHLLVVDKPAGMVVHPAPGNWSGTLVNALLGRGSLTAVSGEERPGIVHRIDKETSGLLLAARSTASFDRLRASMQAGAIEKRYLAIAHGTTALDGRIDRSLEPDPSDARRVRTRDASGPRVTAFRRLDVRGDFSLLEVTLVRGYRHQIRAHLASVPPTLNS